MLLESRVKVSPPPAGFHPKPFSANLHLPCSRDRSRWMLSKLSLMACQLLARRTGNELQAMKTVDCTEVGRNTKVRDLHGCHDFALFNYSGVWIG